MWMFARGVLLAGVLAGCLTGCFLDRSALGTAPSVTFTVEPTLICPGDPVTLAWDASGVHRDPAYCRIHGREFAEPIACAHNGECPDAAVCLDGFCCSRAVLADFGTPACPSARGCLSPFDVTITADTMAIEPPVDRLDRPVRGTREVFPIEDTQFTLEYGEIRGRDTLTRRVQVVSLEPPTRRPVIFPFVCEGGPGWQRVDMAATFPSLSPSVRVIRVRNTSGFPINIGSTDPLVGPISLAPGDSTEELNGPPVGIWGAGLDPSHPRAVIRPICRPTAAPTNPWPDLQVEVTLGC